jgi:hypothetical protein
VVIFGWSFVVAAILIQLVAVVLLMNSLIFRRPSSQILIVPCVLWYVGLVVRGGPFFLDSSGVEMAIVVIVHLTVVVAAYVLRRATSGNETKNA